MKRVSDGATGRWGDGATEREFHLVPMRLYGGESPRRPIAPSPRLFFLLAALLLSTGCSRRDPEAEMRAALAATRAKARACIPTLEPEGNFKLAIAAVSREPDETSVRVAAYALGEPADFDLPLYFMSRGRWLINERGRAYLLDEQCHEYKLKDRRVAPGQPAPKDGRVRLKPGEVFEATLSFPRLPDEAREGVLVYGTRVLPFSLLVESR